MKPIEKINTGSFANDCIVTALIELMKVKEYDSISITDIARKAGISRMTYYRNYSSKEDVLNCYMEAVGNSIHESLEDVGNSNRLHDYFAQLFLCLGAHSDIGVAVLKANMGELILHYVEKNMRATFGSETMSKTDEYKISVLAGGFCNLFMKWIAGGLRETAEEMANICCSMFEW